MGKRRKARELALQYLYLSEITKDEKYSDDPILSDNNIDSETKDFAITLIKGVIKNKDSIDKNISRFADNWEIGRMAVVDKNLLRQSIFEILYCNDIPPKVTINEAIEIAKKFSTEESSRFINGILDRIKKEFVK